MSTTADILARAKQFHRSGQLEQAESLYRQVLAAEPGNFEALLLCGAALLGRARANEAVPYLVQAARIKPSDVETNRHLVIALEACGRFDDAIGVLEQVRRFYPNSPELSEDLHRVSAAKEFAGGFALAAQGKLDESAACYRRALQWRPDFADAHYNLGIGALGQRHFDEAERSFRRAAELKPDFAEAHNNLALAPRELHRPIEAVPSFRRALELRPDFAEAHNNLGLVLRDLGQLDSAAESFRRALNVRPDFAMALSNLALVLLEQQCFDEAAACCRRAVELAPGFAGAHVNLALALREQKQLAEAEQCCRQALLLQPDSAEARNCLAMVLQDLGQIEASDDMFRQALELSPDYAEPHFNLANSAVKQKKLVEAEQGYRRAIELKPDYVDAHYNRALTLLMLGQLEAAWPEYEWRFRRRGMAEQVLPGRRWTGEPLAGQSILLRCEQGFGDTLQFIRYAELVKQRGGTTIVEVTPPLRRLIERCPSVDSVVVAGGPAPRFDVHLPLLSLPGVFRTSLETIPNRVPYLEPSQESLDQWRGELGSVREFKVGIAWQGDTAYRHDASRSIPLAEFAPLAEVPGVRLFSLQVGTGREQLLAWSGVREITDLGDRVGDFHNTAAVMRNLDLIITCDSVSAHLAGAVGVPVWVALSYISESRWMLDRADSPWYPTMRLFRQASLGDWPGVFRAMQEQLACLT